MQRVRIGLTGLAFVFLAVLLAAIFTGQAADEVPVTPNSIGRQQDGAPAAAAPPAEPLAVLGVAPGNAESNAAARETPPPAQ